MLQKGNFFKNFKNCCCFFRVNIEMALKSSFDKIVILLEYPHAMLFNLFIFELKCILNCPSKADSIM